MSGESHDDSDPASNMTGTEPANLLDTLQERAESLFADLRAYQAYLQANGKEQMVEFRLFKKGIESELKGLKTRFKSEDEQSTSKDPTESELEEIESRRSHTLRSSNLPFYEAVWNVVCQSQRITAIGKRVYCHDGSRLSIPGTRAISTDAKTTKKDLESRKSATIDVIADDGLQWTKVSTVTEKRLLFEMAKEGWEGYGDWSDSDQEDETEDTVKPTQKEEASRLEIVRLAHILRAASRETRINFKHPRIRFILPKIREGMFDDIDAVLAEIRALDIDVVCGRGDDEPLHDQRYELKRLGLNTPDPDVRNILPSSYRFSPHLTPVLNIDCTILLALVSDISHISEADLPAYPSNVSGHYHKTIKKQIACENSSPLLPMDLYPVIIGRKLICTQHAAQRMREIVDTMGTATERKRAAIIVGNFMEQEPGGTDTCPTSHQTASPERVKNEEEESRQRLSRLSCHAVPSDLRIPIREVGFDPEHIDFDDDDVSTQNFHSASISASVLTTKTQNRPILTSHLDRRILQRLSTSQTLTPINKSVFLHGWINNLVTVTSNRAVATNVFRYVETLLDEYDDKTTDIGHDGDGHGDDMKEGGGGGGGGEFQGPKIHVCGTARSLIGKEKQSFPSASHHHHNHYQPTLDPSN